MKSMLGLFGMVGVSAWAICSLANLVFFRLLSWSGGISPGGGGMSPDTLMALTGLLSGVGTLSMWFGGVAIALAAMARDPGSTTGPGKP